MVDGGVTLLLVVCDVWCVGVPASLPRAFPGFPIPDAASAKCYENSPNFRVRVVVDEDVVVEGRGSPRPVSVPRVRAMGRFGTTAEQGEARFAAAMQQYFGDRRVTRDALRAGRDALLEAAAAGGGGPRRRYAGLKHCSALLPPASPHTRPGQHRPTTQGSPSGRHAAQDPM